eukprot:COSAG06_NODE_6260_length_3009_cov_7.058559_4_plen_88_part_00
MCQSGTVSLEQQARALASQAEQSRAQQSRAEQSTAQQSRAQHSRSRSRERAKKVRESVCVMFVYAGRLLVAGWQSRATAAAGLRAAG